jgi:hypothetical protein
MAVNGMTAFELRNVVSRPLGMVPQSTCPVAPTVRGFADQRPKLGGEGTGRIDRDTGSDEASITYA